MLELNFKILIFLLKWRRRVHFMPRFKIVEEPKEYYTIISLIDTIEFIYRINKKKMIDKELWQRWENHAKSMMTIPKFRKVWSATREFHTRDFVNFMDGL